MAQSNRMADLLGHTLITGGCGFLGHHIVKQIFERYPGTKVSVLDLRTTRNRINGADYYDGDITDEASLRQLFEKLRPNTVIHTVSPIYYVSHNHDLVWKVNVEGTKTMLKVSQETGVKAFVYTSSASVISDMSSDLINADERWPKIVGKEQKEFYTTTKAIAEDHVLAANRTPPTFLTCAIRPSGMIGEGDVQTIPPMVRAYQGGKTKFQIGDNNNMFDFTYIGNIAQAHLLAAALLNKTLRTEKPVPDEDKVDGEAFIITNDEPAPFWDFSRAVWAACGDKTRPKDVWVLPGPLIVWAIWVVEILMKLVGKQPNVTSGAARISTMTRYFNIDKAKRRLNYRPLVRLDEGIKRAVNDYLERQKREQAEAAEKKGQ